MNTSATSLTRYYQFHASIYDATRWSFLFGREGIIKEVSRRASPRTILEIGCGTGHNLDLLCRAFPEAQVTGVDLSGAMLAKAKEKLKAHGDRVQLREAAYNAPLGGNIGGYDLILASYALTMFNPGWEQALEAAHADLASHGRLAVVDFHRAQMPGFGKWMSMNHVRMEGHLLEGIEKLFDSEVCKIKSAYGGVWQFLQFVGHRKNTVGL